MVLQLARTLLSEFAHAVRPWRNGALGGRVLANQEAWQLAGVGSAGCDGRESEDLFGPLWFAVPKKRVSWACGRAHAGADGSCYLSRSTGRDPMYMYLHAQDDHH